MIVKKGRTSYIAKVFIQDTRQADGRGLTGLAFNTAGLSCTIARDSDGNADAFGLALVTMTRGTWVSGGFVQKDAVNMPGIYEFGVPDAALAAGSESALFMFKGAANMAVCVLSIQLVAYDPQAAAPDVNVVTIEGVDASNAIRDSVFGGVVENGKTFVQMVRGIVAATFGKAAGLNTTTAHYRDHADTKDRITATVDEFGNRSVVATDLD